MVGAASDERQGAGRVSAVRCRAPGERPEAVMRAEELGEDWIVCVVGRV